jgi:hypothetical protein
MQIPAETSTWLLQAKEFLYEARRLKPGPERRAAADGEKVLLLGLGDATANA